MLMQLKYVVVYCSDMQRSIVFYRDQLGFPVRLESPGWTEFHTGATTLALHLGKPSGRAKPQPGETPAGEAHLGLEVLDIEKFYQEKKERGIEFVLPPTTRGSGRKLAVCLDPDGLPISVTEEIR